MENWPEKIYFFMAILLSFLLVACLACADYDELIEMDILSSIPAYENPDLEGLKANKQDRDKLFVQSAFPVICFSSFFFIEQLPHFCSPILSSPRSMSVLRC
jgi:hypothetical protein